MYTGNLNKFLTPPGIVLLNISMVSRIKAHLRPDITGFILPDVLKLCNLPDMINMIILMHKTSVEVIFKQNNIITLSRPNLSQRT